MLVEKTNIKPLCALGLGLPQPMALIVLSEQVQTKPQQQCPI